MKLRDLERHLAVYGATNVAEGARHSRHLEIGPGLVRAICRQLDIPNP